MGIVNLEGPIGGTPDAKRSGLRLIQSPEIVKELLAAGVRVASLDNNHAGDLGAAGRANTSRRLRAAGILPIRGVARLGRWRLGSRTVALAAFDLTHGEPAGMLGDLKRARAMADLLIVSLHVTAPESYLPTATLESAVEHSLEAGARVIVSHGTHRLARVERRGEAVIAWGLGNLAFACDCTAEDEGLVLRVSFISGDSLAADVVPVRAGLRGQPVRPHEDVVAVAELLRALGSSPLRRIGSHILF